MSRRKGDWLQTYTGKCFYYDDPRPSDITIEDIAHALSQINRFCGHTRKPYSVAEHSVRGSLIVPAHLAYDFLMHDSPESVCQDLPRPLKYLPGMEVYRDYERRVAEVIAKKFKLRFPEPAEVKYADRVMLLTEQRDLLGQQAKPWEATAIPLKGIIRPWSAKKAEKEFLLRFEELKGRKN